METPTIAKVPTLNIEHDSGDSFLFSLTLETSSPIAPVDLTGRTYTMTIATPTPIVITGSLGTPSAGIVTFTKTKTESAALVSGQYNYDIHYTMSSGATEVTQLKGKIIVP